VVVQEAAVAAVHESAVALIESSARQLTGSPAPSHSTDITGMPHGMFLRAVFPTCGRAAAAGCGLVTATVVGARALLTQLRVMLVWGIWATC
jgi:hypothetical protein